MNLTDYHSKEMQNTLQREVEVSGTGIFTGERSSVKICPAPEGSGLFFQRVDLEGSPKIPALAKFVQETPRCTRLSNENASVMMVEHLLSALYACGVDNARICIEGPEVPGLDGSSKLFVDLIEKAGLRVQSMPRSYITVQQPVFWSQKDVHLVALPSSEFRLSYTMHYPKCPLIKSQYYSLTVDPVRYREEIAPCRTFSLY